MPIFEYQCTSCGNEFEQLVLSSSPPPECPSCHSPELNKRMSLPMIRSEAATQRNIRDQKRRVHQEHQDQARSADPDDHHHTH